MIAATRQTSLYCTLLLAGAIAEPARGQDAMTIDADAPVVEISERAPGRHALQLPTLDYQLEIRMQCSGERTPKSLSLNVADTRKIVKSDDIVAGGATPVTMRVPATQIPPLVVENFCLAPGEPPQAGARVSNEQRRIPAALSIQASLLCANGGDNVMTYASQALDVLLRCERPGAAEASIDGR